MSERIGCVLFKLLRDRGVELFADEPEVTALLGKERILRAARDFDVLELAAEFPETAYPF